MKTAIIVALLAGVCAIPVFAADTVTNTRGQGQGESVEQKKTEILQQILERITNSQAEMTCVKSAQSHDELKSCREKYRPQQKKNPRSQTPKQ